MTDPNRNALWGRAIVEELAAAGVEAACVAPGSRSTPLVLALDAHPDVRVFSHLDERSAAFFALGRGRTGAPTAVVTTSGTAAAELHPAVIEADRGRVPLLALTADRPRELRDSGANQTVDQERLYGDAVRFHRSLPAPAAEDRRLRSLRTTVARAVGAAVGRPAGPVHVNVPFAKPLAPTRVPGDVPERFADDAPLAAGGRDGPYVRTTRGRPTPDAAALDDLAAAVADAERGLLVAGPADPLVPQDALATLARDLDWPLLADPLSGLRFGAHVPGTPVVGGYDAYLDAVTGTWPNPDVVLRVGASPTSKALRSYLRDVDARQFVVDPAGGWREATFTATDLLVAEPESLVAGLRERLGDAAGLPRWRARFADAEAAHRNLLAEATDAFEGAIPADVVDAAPDPATVLVSNSMPVRDLDRYGRPRAADLTVLGNRGASGIDGVTSTALGAASATDAPLVAVTGDLAYYHDMNGLLALVRCGVDATIVVVDNDGGGIFHRLPVADYDPPFTELFETPHGLDFAPTGALYDLDYERVDGRAALRDRLPSVVGDGRTVLEVRTDAAAAHDEREALRDRLCGRLGVDAGA